MTRTPQIRAAVALSLLFLLAQIPGAAAACNFGPNNAFVPHGDIGKAWERLGRESGSGLGCPISGEMKAADGAGVVQAFQFGEISWSHGRGDHPTLIARQAGLNAIELLWSGVEPFNYDFWIVRTDHDNANVAQEDIKTDRTNGYYVFRRAVVGGNYSFVVEGCDEVDIEGRKARCRQGWLNRVAVKMQAEPSLKHPTFNDPPKRGTPCWNDENCIKHTVQFGVDIVKIISK
jgi:hypothetical protein